MDKNKSCKHKLMENCKYFPIMNKINFMLNILNTVKGIF